MFKFNALMISATTATICAASAFADTAPLNDMKMTKQQCATLWTKALGSSSGDLAMDKAKPYVTDFKKSDSNSDGKLSSSEWMAACDNGWVKTASASEPGPNTADRTSDRTPSGATERTTGAGATGAAGTDAGQTSNGTSDRTPSK